MQPPPLPTLDRQYILAANRECEVYLNSLRQLHHTLEITKYIVCLYLFPIYFNVVPLILENAQAL